MLERTPALASVFLLLSACSVDPIPSDDSVAPTVTVSTVERGAIRIIASREPRDGTPVDCGNGPGVSGDVAQIAGYPIHLLATVSDAGGVAYVMAEVANGNVSNVQPAGVVQTTRSIGGQELHILSKTFARSEAFTSRFIEFDVNPTGTTMGLAGVNQFQVSGAGRDYHDNMAYTGRPVVGPAASFCG